MYQLVTAVHLKQNCLQNEETDLLLTDNLLRKEHYAVRLKETNLFCRVIQGTIKEWNAKYSFASQKEIEALFEKIPQLFRFALTDVLGNYRAVYFSNFDMFTRMLAWRYREESCTFIGYEDGFSSYVIDYLREDRAPINRYIQGQAIGEKTAYMLLYEPKLAMRCDHIPNRPLPKIQKSDTALKEALNFIFQYRPLENPADFLFLEQSFRAEGIKGNDLELMKECQQIVGSSRFAVKPHPRNPENLPLRLGLTRPYLDDTPWELFLLNQSPEGLCLLTVCSNAALTGRLVFHLDIPTVLLYRLFTGKILWKEDVVLKKYLRRFEDRFAGKNCFVPKSYRELKHILDYLGGKNGK